MTHIIYTFINFLLIIRTSVTVMRRCTNDFTAQQQRRSQFSNPNRKFNATAVLEPPPPSPSPPTSSFVPVQSSSDWPLESLEGDVKASFVSSLESHLTTVLIRDNMPTKAIASNNLSYINTSPTVVNTTPKTPQEVIEIPD